MTCHMLKSMWQCGTVTSCSCLFTERRQCEEVQGGGQFCITQTCTQLLSQSNINIVGSLKIESPVAKLYYLQCSVV